MNRNVKLLKGIDKYLFVADAVFGLGQEILQRYFRILLDSRFVERRAQRSVRKFKMLAIWISITEGSPTARSRVLTILTVSTCFVTCTIIRSIWEKRLARSVNHAAKLHVGGGDESPPNWLHLLGILKWYRSSAATSSSALIRSPHKPSSVAALMDCNQHTELSLSEQWNG